MIIIDFVLDHIDDLRLDESITAEGVYALDRLRARITDKPVPDKYYKIITKWLDEPIGKCHYSAISDVKQEEPESNFFEISKEEFEKEED